MAATGGAASTERSDAPSAWSAASPAFLAHVLRATLTGPGAEAEPVAAQVAADVLVALAEAGAASAGAWALAVRPGEPASYEVRSFTSGSLDPADPFSTDDPDVAILATRDRALHQGMVAELLSRDRTGVQRCVLSQTAGGLRYRFPELACIDAPDGAMGGIADAVAAWRAVLDDGLSPTTSTRPKARGGADPEVVARRVVELLVADGRALRTHDVADVLASLIPAPAEVADLLVERLVAHFEGAPSEAPPPARARRKR